MSGNGVQQEATVTERAFTVVRAHKNTGSGVGPLRKWLKELYANSGKLGKAYREAVRTIHKDNSLADKVCSLAEEFTEKKGDPWKRS